MITNQSIALEQIADVLAALDRHLGDRITIRQAMALVSIMQSNAMGDDPTVSEVQLDVVGIPYRSVVTLQTMGLIVLEKSQGDRRNTIARLTDEGRALAEEVAGLVTELE